MMQDFRFALRQLRKNPGFAAVAVMTLALGIGTAGAMFGLIQGVLLSPPPYANPDRLVLVSPARIDGQRYDQGATIGQWMAWRAASRSLETPALYRWTFNFLVLPDGSESLGGMVVTRDYFRLLGLKPVLGREFVESEAGRPKVPPTAIILGYELWQRRFNGDPHIVGTAIRISRYPAPLPVVGVMPPGVRFLPDPANASEPNYDVNAHVDFWLSTVPDETQPKSSGLNAISRLRDGATLAQAQAEIAAITAGQAHADADHEGLTATVRPVQDELNHDGRLLLMPLFGSVALLFLIACANVAGLLLARGLQRQQEYALRSALGAGRARLFRQTLTESVTLALVGATLGAGLGAGIITLLKAIGGHAVPRLDAVTVGWPVFAFGLVAALLAAAVAGLLPAARAASPDRFQSIKGTRSSAGRAERRLLGGVATLQIVMTVALLVGAALLIRTANNLARVRPGYDTENVLAMTVTTVQREKWKEFHTQALERIAKLPGVKHVAFVWGLPLTGNKWSGDMDIIGVGQPGSSKLTDKLNLPLRAVTPDYFDALGVQIVDGRGFRQADDGNAPQVAVINQTLARRYFHESNPIGRKMRFTGDTDIKHITEIVGVVSDTRTEALSQRAEPEIYFPLWQFTAFSKHLVVRAASNPQALAALVRGELRAVDPTSAVEHITTMEEIRNESIAPRTFAMRLLTGFAFAATALALVGLYGVLSLSVGSRTKEIAVRKAVGAQAYEILRLILGEGSRMIALGLALGTVLAILLGHILEALLFEVQPADPMALAGAAVLFGAVALGACLLPAWRAARVDLMDALRQE
jgi:putative ABC transport system permease protein